MKYKCNTCHKNLEDVPSEINQRLIDHAEVCMGKNHNKKLYQHCDYDYVHPAILPHRGDQFLAVFNYDDAIKYRNETILPQLHKVDNEQTKKIPTSKYSEAKGGVKKKFFPEQGMVVAGDKDTARGDYEKEDAVFDRVDGEDAFKYLSFQEKIGDHEDDDGFQQFLQNNPKLKNLEKSQMRRVSIYGSLNPEDIGRQYHCTLEKFILEHDQHEPKEDELISAIHQIIKIHEFLYLQKITHGDMHMGNIKVIRVEDGVLLKAFDFGKSVTKSLNRNYTRTDLRYLLLKKAVSGGLETFKRNVVRKDSSSAQQKHYPLHRVTALLIKQFHPSSFTVEATHGRIELYGKQLLQNLENARATGIDDYQPLQRMAIRKMFELFSNQIVHAMYQLPVAVNH